MYAITLIAGEETVVPSKRAATGGALDAAALRLRTKGPSETVADPSAARVSRVV